MVGGWNFSGIDPELEEGEVGAWLLALGLDESAGLSLWVAGFAPRDAWVEGCGWFWGVAEWAGFHGLVSGWGWDL